VHWGGDCEATFESMAEDLRGGLSFCMSGAAFWSHDIGGFSGKANPALYKRWVAFGLLSTHSRLHGSESYRVPWLFDEESVDVLRHFTRLKNRLFPYLYAAAHDAAQHGWPVMRAMVLEFPSDPGCHYLDRQYMLGPSLLVAPVFREDGVAEYYLPAGRWTDLESGRASNGGRWCREVVGFMRIPLFARQNSLIPMAAADDRPGWNAEELLVLHCVEVAEGAEAAARVIPTSGDSRVPATFVCARRNRRITVSGNGVARRVRVAVRASDLVGGATPAVTNGAVVGIDVHGLVVEWDDPTRPVVIDCSRPAIDGVEVRHARARVVSE
jgi:alpha-D-xyloside xylohydrolase